MHMGLDALILTRNSLGIDRDESSTPKAFPLMEMWLWLWLWLWLCGCLCLGLTEWVC